ncbi:MAG: hypothetical protein ACK5RW_02190, partial [bacterium]
MTHSLETGFESAAATPVQRTLNGRVLLGEIDRALGQAVGLVGTARHERGKVRLAVGTLVRASG